VTPKEIRRQETSNLSLQHKIFLCTK